MLRPANPRPSPSTRMSFIMKNVMGHAPLSALLAACVMSLLLCSFASAQRASPSLKSGEYVTEGGWGNLSLRAGNNRSMLFAIESTGGNLHVCSLDGEIESGKATLEGIDEKTPCVVTFTQTGEGVKVSANEPDACRDYCGARASFEGLYLLPSARCTKDAVATSRKSFKQLYDTRQYADALAKLSPVLTLCSRTMNRSEEGRIRNDLAVTMHKLNDLSGCLLVLEPLANDAALTDAAVRENYAPSDAEMMLPIVRAARTNLKLCGNK
jgi:hypothetical protein